MSPSPATPSYNRSRYDRAASEIDDDDISVASSGFPMNNPNKYLIIRRLVKDGITGEKTWQQETVRDPTVIKSYLRQRQMIEEEATR
jgi:hypothetical protein